ncbi:unnamed protein product [Phyllotreta striolata]|uniref:Uncharacterized protein n=1 Tax=Phyllotreta striolata TaxID=444603 RepID=A0A9N9XMN3_PHYSR|nr:unnamed protein product [Phyllotreta striolata]
MRIICIILCIASLSPITSSSSPYYSRSHHHHNSESYSYLCLVLGLCSGSSNSHYSGDKLTTVYQWKYLNYAYDSAQQMQTDYRTGNLVPRKPAPIDVDVYYDRRFGHQKVFVTSPRFQAGVPAALGMVVLDRNGEPYVKPYPSWGWHENPARCNRDRIVSVYRIEIDECDRLWVLDNGQLDENVICPPQLLVFDLRNDRLIHRYEIPRDQYQIDSTFVTPIVEVKSRANSCRNTFVYAADCVANSILVYDMSKEKSWVFKHSSMYPDPDWANYHIAGESFDIMDGVLGMALSPALSKEGRKLYYHAMSSDTEHWVYTKDLQNQTATENAQIFNTYTGRRGTQSAAEAVDSDGILYFGLMSEIDVACFDTRGKYGRNCPSTDIVARNNDTLQFISGMKVVRNPRGVEELWLLSSRFQKVANDNIRNNEYNFRIMKGNVEELKKGTKCQRGGYPGKETTARGAGPVIFPDNNRKR